MNKNTIFKLLSVPVIGFCTLSVFLISWVVTIEGYYRPDPWIDTKTSSGYTEEKFNQIKVGMTKTEVFNIMGTPYYPEWSSWNSKDSSNTAWDFTSDGKFDDGDFAWMGRSIYFNDSGEVIEIYRKVHYD
jgi:outer membrane protein assembly factor BamE (lipoprotein component of BamABCDE complex)